MPIPVARLNHAVFFVRDAERAAAFYGRVFGFEVVGREFGGKAIFMRAAGATTITTWASSRWAPTRPAARGSVGLYHLAGGPDHRRPRGRFRILSEAGALGGASDHGVSKSLYGTDPTGTSSRSCGASPARRGETSSTTAPCSRSISMPSSAGGAKRAARGPEPAVALDAAR